MDKNGVSPVIATVLLLVLTVIIAGVIFSVVIPFVKDSLGDSKVCLNALEGVQFAESKFNCFNSSTISTSGFETGLSIKLNKEEISGFRVALTDETGSSDVFDIKSGAEFENVRMVRSTWASAGEFNAVEFPSVGGQRSYVVAKKYQKAEVSPIMTSGEICSVADTIEFEPCYRDVVL